MANNNLFTNSKKKKAFDLIQENRFAEAKTLFAEICEQNRTDAEAWFALGVINGKLNNVAESIESFHKTISLQPGHALAHYNLGLALRGQGKVEEAANAFQAVTRLAPQRPEPYINLGNILMTLGRMEEAAACYRTLLKLTPSDAEALTRLGRILHVQGHLEEAVSCYRRALRIEPKYASVYDNLAAALCNQGMFAEAMANHSKALELAPDDEIAHSNFLFTMLYLPEQNPDKILAEHRRWAQVHANVPGGVPRHANSRDPERRLRVGYVSADFRSHAVAFFFEPLLTNHDRNVVEAVCYSGVARPDATTERLRSMASQWRDIGGLGAEQVASMIRADGIDILVDLAGHTSGTRLKVFAHKPAPIQVTYLGYPTTTGLPAMDYRLTDELADPEGEDVYYTEKLLRLPGAFLCYRPLENCPPVSPLPAMEKGYVTFGSFNNLSKISPSVIGLWVKLLQEVPGARLFVKNPSLTDPATRERYYGLFEVQGAARDRVELQGRTATQAEHLALYSRLDIALDTFPYNGTTTTCEAVWMGVPVITLAAKRHAGRVGVSILSNAGFGEWIAQTPEQYITLAAGLAEDVQKLAALRASLRQRMSDSPLCDGQAFARKIETAYREIWRAWCAS
jgi:predicted O-linked N-acetylglucosamine transferase (SPINDLY family)